MSISSICSNLSSSYSARSPFSFFERSMTISMSPRLTYPKYVIGLSIWRLLTVSVYISSKEDNGTPFGTWDYVSHQVAASPFKPIDYMDKNDW